MALTCRKNVARIHFSMSDKNIESSIIIYKINLNIIYCYKNAALKYCMDKLNTSCK